MDSARIEQHDASHPGQTVLDYLEFHDWSQRDLARRSGLTPKTISEICAGKAPITPPTALAFEKVFQRPAHFWLNLQRNFDEARARQFDLTRQDAWSDWVRTFPLREMKRLGFSLPDRGSDAERLLHFFGVSSPDSWRSVWDAYPIHYRQTRVSSPKEAAIAAWVRQTEIEGRQIRLSAFSEEKLLESLPELRRLSRTRADEIIEPLQALCAAAGVAVVWVPELKNTGISGCARWFNDKWALIGLTLRYKTDDQLWFTFFHEVGHVLLHRHRRAFVIDNPAVDVVDRVVNPDMQKFEEEANRFSGDALIPSRALDAFIRKAAFTNDSIYDFAENVGVGPGIVVGRLQRDGLLEHHQGNALKQKLHWGIEEE
jgi:HTH-type transcriptional regulator / antitoxin HigA